MQPRSALLDATIAQSHTMIVRADILTNGQVIATGLPVKSGSVTGNRTQFARRTCTVVIPDPAYIPAGKKGDLLAPYGNEIRLWRGAVTPAGPELIPVGTFGIRSVDWDSGGAFAGITVTGIDRCKAISEARFPFPRTSPDGIMATDMVRILVSEVLPYAEIRVDPEVWDMQLPQVTWTNARDTAITDMVASLGAEFFFDPLGAAVIQPVPTLADPPVYTVTGGSGGILVSARHTLSRDNVYNAVVARGSTTSSATTAPTSILMADTDPTSATYVHGPYGMVVGFYDSSLLTDADQCNNAAAAMLANSVGAARSINYSTAVHPALEPGDVVAVIDPVTGTQERHLQDQLTIPLGVDGLMTAQTRSSTAIIWNPRKRRTRNYGGNLS